MCLIVCVCVFDYLFVCLCVLVHLCLCLLANVLACLFVAHSFVCLRVCSCSYFLVCL